MKTSNKILLSGFIFLIVSTLTAMVITKNNMEIIPKGQQEGDGNGVMKTVVLSNNLESDVLKLSSNYDFILDPNTNAITVTTDENLVNTVRLSDEGSLYFYREGTLRYYPTEGTKVHIGVAGKSKLFLQLGNRASVKGIGLVHLDLNIEAEDRSKVHLNVDNANVVLDLRNRAVTELSGTARKLSVEADDESKLYAEDFVIQSSKIEVSDSAMLKIGQSDSVSIQMSNNAVLEFSEQWKWHTGLDLFDSAQLNVAGKKWQAEKQ